MSTDPPLAASLAADPFTALAVHYGMLLGVPDFQVISANPRGKLRLHQSWQHGPGVIWGYDVTVPADSPELQVSAGLAVDGVGREVSLGSPYCVDVAQWLDEQVAAGTVVPVEAGSTKTFNAQLYLRFRGCLTRPVPAMSSACDGGGDDVAYSRILETGELELRPYPNDADGDPSPPADDRDGTFPDLRALVRDGAGAVTGDDGESWLDAFRRIAAQESAALAPPALAGGAPTSSRLFPTDEPGEILLADLPGLQITTTASGPTLTAPTIDLAVRRTHVPTWLIEELLAELLAGHAGAHPEPDAGGARVARVSRADKTVTIELTADIIEGTLAPAFEVRTIDLGAANPAWGAPLAITPAFHAAVTTAPTAPATITFDLPAAPTATVSYRLIVRGTGSTPLLTDGARPVPLAGYVGGPAGRAADGHDVVEIFEGAQP
jgi:hypothetical protein